MENISENDKNKILWLYFDKVRSYDEIVAYFKNKYSYNQIKAITRERYDSFDNAKIKGKNIRECVEHLVFKEIDSLKKEI